MRINRKNILHVDQEKPRTEASRELPFRTDVFADRFRPIVFRRSRRRRIVSRPNVPLILRADSNDAPPFAPFFSGPRPLACRRKTVVTGAWNLPRRSNPRPRPFHHHLSIRGLTPSSFPIRPITSPTGKAVVHTTFDSFRSVNPDAYKRATSSELRNEHQRLSDCPPCITAYGRTQFE